MAILAGSCMLLGFVSEAGGNSLSNAKTKESIDNLSTEQEEVWISNVVHNGVWQFYSVTYHFSSIQQYDALIQGYGFAAFFHIW